MNVVVTSAEVRGVLVIRATAGIHLSHRVAEAFTPYRELSLPIHEVLVSTFGDFSFKWYCIDMSSSDVSFITFSNAANPSLFHYQDQPAAIAPVDRAPFSLMLRASELIKPGRLSPNAQHPAFIS